MSIESNKLVNLADAQVLYNDLRDRESDLKSAFLLHTYTASVVAEQGQIGSSAGDIQSSTTRLRTAFLPRGVIKLSANSGYKYMLFAFQSDGTYVGVWNGSSFAKSGSWKENVETAIPNINYLYRVVFSDHDNNTIEASAISNLIITASTDDQFIKAGIPADGLSIGKYLEPIAEHGTLDAMYPYGEKAYSTDERSGVTCTNHGDGTWTLKGTATGDTFCDIFRQKPIKPGLYYVDLHGGTVRFRIYLNKSDSTSTLHTFNANGYLKVDDDVVSHTTRFMIVNGKVYDETVRYTVIRIADERYYPGKGLFPTGGNTDRTAEIESILKEYKYCKLQAGQYYVHNLCMPDNTMIEGEGFGTEIKLISDELPEGNLYTLGDQTFTGYEDLDFTTPLPAGKYTVTATAVSNDTDSNRCAVYLYTGGKHTVDVAARGTFTRNTSQTFTMDIERPVTGISLVASDTFGHSTGDTATFSDISLVCTELYETALIMGSECTIKDVQICGFDTEHSAAWPGDDENHNGILFGGSESHQSKIMKGVIDGCLIRDFAGGGIRLQYTGYASMGGLNISNCDIERNFCGIYNKEDSEFHRITNVSMTQNKRGCFCNGANNQFADCGFNSNGVGFWINVYKNNGISGEKRTNTAHGGMTNCNFMHNTNRSIVVDGAVSGFCFTGCNIDGNLSSGNYTKPLLFRYATNIVFSGCNFMNWFEEIEVIGKAITDGGATIGNFILFNGSSFRPEFTTVLYSDGADPTQIKFDSCYLWDGTPFEPNFEQA